MSKAAGVAYLEEVPVGTFVRVGDLPGSQAAARQCLVREARDPHGLVARVGHGLYWRAKLYDQPLRDPAPAQRPQNPATAAGRATRPDQRSGRQRRPAPRPRLPGSRGADAGHRGRRLRLRPAQRAPHRLMAWQPPPSHPRPGRAPDQAILNAVEQAVRWTGLTERHAHLNVKVTPRTGGGGGR